MKNKEIGYLIQKVIRLWDLQINFYDVLLDETQTTWKQKMKEPNLMIRVPLRSRFEDDFNIRMSEYITREHLNKVA